jgi:hypothetical protein
MIYNILIYSYNIMRFFNGILIFSCSLVSPTHHLVPVSPFPYPLSCVFSQVAQTFQVLLMSGISIPKYSSRTGRWVFHYSPNPKRIRTPAEIFWKLSRVADCHYFVAFNDAKRSTLTCFYAFGHIPHEEARQRSG